jgi:hypothetical protein
MTRSHLPFTAALALSLFATGCLRMPGLSDGLSCNALGADADAQKIEAFLDTSARFEADTLALSADVEGTCAAMAEDLGMEIPSATEDQLQVEATCGALALEIRSIVDAALPRDASLDVAYDAPECTVDLDAMASCVAECDASLSASSDIECVDSPDQRICTGDSSARADAQCEASCDARVSVRASCTEPSLYVDARVSVDPAAQARLDALLLTLDANYPRFLALEARLEEVATSSADLVTSFGGAADAAGRSSVRAMACLADASAVAAESVRTVDVTFSVSIEVSASVSASAQAG